MATYLNPQSLLATRPENFSLNQCIKKGLLGHKMASSIVSICLFILKIKWEVPGGSCPSKSWALSQSKLLEKKKLRETKKAGSLIEIYDKEEERRNKKVPRASVVRRDLKGEFGSSRCMKITKKKKETGAVDNFSLSIFTLQ